MKKVSHKIFKSLISTLLAIAMLVTCTLNVFAEGRANETLYVKAVKLIYAESLNEAKHYVPDGYTLLEKNLNEGTDSDNKVYFAYATTTNPDEAAPHNLKERSRPSYSSS